MIENHQKVLLYVYPRLDKFIKDIDFLVESRAYASIDSRKNTESLANEIISLINVKDKFLDLKIVLEKIFTKFTFEETYLLEYKYFRRSEVLNSLYANYACDFTERTYFRKQNKVLKKFTEALISRGMSEEWFLQEYKDINFMMVTYKKICLGQDKRVYDKRLKKALCCKQNIKKDVKQVVMPTQSEGLFLRQ